MNRIEVAEVDNVLSPASVKREVGAALGVEGFALNYFELDPGESFSNTLHAHFDQEEVFYLLEGMATFDTDDGSVEVEAGEALRFEPGEYQHGRNPTEERVVALVLGAPKDSHEGSMACPSCGARESPAVSRTEDAVVFSCGACGSEINRHT